MSTTKPMKFKPVSENWETILGEKNETPTSFDFSKQSNINAKGRKGYENHYVYTDEDGHTAFVVERKTKEGGDKYFTLHSKQRHKGNHSEKWMAKQYPEPRPIYNLYKLATDRTKINLVVVEGEKAANAYGALNLHKVTTWACGAYAVLQNDWNVAAQYDKVILCPDNDVNGFMAMHKLAKHLVEDLEYDIGNLKWVEYDEAYSDGWDLADDIPADKNYSKDKLVHSSRNYVEVWEDYKKKWTEIDAIEINKEVNKDKKLRLLEIGEDCCYIEELNEILRLSKDTLVPLPHFNNSYAYLKMGQKGAGTYLLEQETTKRADKFIYHPKYPKGIIQIDGISYANRFRGPNIIGKHGSVAHWEEQLMYMFGSDADFMEQYFAWCFQNMGEKAMWAPIWISEQRGIGKNWVTNLICKAYGMHNAKPNLKYKNVVSKFPDWIIGTQFAVINEIFIQNRHDKKMEMSEEIKDLITELFIHIEQKFRRSFDYYNTCNFVLISNHLNCMYINNEERRYWIKVMNCQEMDRGYWAEKWKWAEGEGPAAIVHHLKNIKIKDKGIYKFRAPQTSDFKEMAANSEHPIFRWLDQQFEEESGPFRRENKYKNFNFLAGVTWLHTAVTKGFSQECSQDVLKDWLKRRCTKWTNGELTKQIVMSDGTRPRVYMILPKDSTGKEYWYKHLTSKTDTQLGELYGEKKVYEGTYSDGGSKFGAYKTGTDK